MSNEPRIAGTNRLFLLKALDEKCRRDMKKKGFCLYGVHSGTNGFMPDAFFADWVRRLSYESFKKHVDSLSADGLIRLFEAENREVYFEVTERGKQYMHQLG
jgi:hypothetical protein